MDNNENEKLSFDSLVFEITRKCNLKCEHCMCGEPEDITMSKEIINKIGEKYGVDFEVDDALTYDPVGCEECNNSGYYDRIAIYETLLFTDKIKELIVNDASTIEIRKEALKESYKPLIVEGIRKVINGTTNLEELNSKLLFY